MPHLKSRNNYRVWQKHALPGRLRLGLDPAAGRARLIATAQGLLSVPAITGVRATKATFSLLIHYDQKGIDPEIIIKKAGQLASQDSFSDFAVSSPRKNISSPKSPLVKPFWRFTALSAVGVAILASGRFLGLGVGQSFLSPLGLICGLTSLPLLWRSFKKRTLSDPGVEGFLGYGAALAVVMGEALTAWEILWIDSGAGLLNAWISERSRKAIAQLLGLDAKKALVVKDGEPICLPLEEVCPGDVLVFQTGDKFSVDGRVVKGKAHVDESSLSGRAEYVFKKEGDSVWAGSYVRQGEVMALADKVGDDTYLARILSQVEDSLQNRAPIQQAADDLACRLVRAGTFLTLASFLITGSFWRAFNVLLIMSCPCATQLAAASAISAAIGQAAKHHILIKGGRYLEESAKVEVICLDKTGTLTSIHPEVVDLAATDKYSQKDLLTLARAAEELNPHPLARAVVAKAGEMGVKQGPMARVDYSVGLGVRALTNGQEVLVGNQRFMDKHGVDLDGMLPDLEKWQAKGLTILFVAAEGEAAGCLALANPLKKEVKDTLGVLRKRYGKELVLVTGDTDHAAKALAVELKMHAHFHSLLPEEKAEVTIRYLKQGKKVMFVGDGVNDALALAYADVGVAMGLGASEIALEASDIALANGDLADLVYLHDLSEKTLALVRQNFWLATTTNIMGVALGLGGRMTPFGAGILHLVHSFGILVNSLRLFFFNPQP
jgi:cation-transporting P-type ATPase C